jgi:riboflavin biosynthesis pyrimidine reductase
MCTTIDGKILSSRWGKLPGTKGGSADLFETTAASFGIGAWIVGTTTMREFSGRDMKLKRAKHRVAAGDHVANPKAKSFAIGIDAKAALRFQENEVDGDHTIVCITDQASQDYRAHLQAVGVSYLVCGQREVNLRIALEKLHEKFGLKKLMAQGGGKFNGSMLREGLVDEISQVIVPVADGGEGISTMFDAGDPVPKSAAAHLRFKSLKKLPGDVHWFRYQVMGGKK